MLKCWLYYVITRFKIVVIKRLNRVIFYKNNLKLVQLLVQNIVYAKMCTSVHVN